MHCIQLVLNLEIVFEKEIEMLHVATFFKTMQNEDKVIRFQERKKKKKRILYTSVGSYH